MGKHIDLTGKRFGRWTVIKRAENERFGRTQWLCQCECGNIKIVHGNSLRKGLSASCGCLGHENAAKARRKHGDAGKRLYGIWKSMIARCEGNLRESKTKTNYKDRGIRVCQEWHDYKVFKEWALKNGYQDNLSIDRIDVNGNYEPSNCRWVNIKTQNNNSRQNHNITYCGETLSLAQWSERLGINNSTLSFRISKGWDIETAFTTPVDISHSRTGRISA